jgi:hypothetical protein
MRNRNWIALFVAPLLGCYVQVEDPSLTLTKTLCTGSDCIPGGSAPLSLIQVSGANTFSFNFGDQPLLQKSTSVGPATMKSTLLLSGAAFDMLTSGADFNGVQSLSVMAVNPGAPAGGPDPCATASNCTTLATYTKPAGSTPGRHLDLVSAGSDLVDFIDPTTHTLVLEIRGSGTAPAPAQWNAQVSMDMSFTSRANLP